MNAIPLGFTCQLLVLILLSCGFEVSCHETFSSSSTTSGDNSLECFICSDKPGSSIKCNNPATNQTQKVDNSTGRFCKAWIRNEVVVIKQLVNGKMIAGGLESLSSFQSAEAIDFNLERPRFK